MNRVFYIVIFIVMLMQNSTPGLAQMSYKVSFPNPNTHYVQVDAVISGIEKDSFELKMPVWIPGSYMVREFSKNVEGFNCRSGDGKELKFKKVRKNSWRIFSNKSTDVHVRYMVYAFELSVRTNFVNDEMAILNGAALFMYTNELMNLPAQVTYLPSPKWSVISTGLPQQGSDKWIRTASNYDQLADAPVVIGNHDEITFDYKGIPHHVAMVGKANYDREKIKKDFYKIIDEETKIFGENPNKEYTFIIINALNSGGGLEHMNSSTIMTARTCYDSEAGYNGFLGLIAHEYFHLWNVKRVRPFELGPFDYDNEVYTNLIWFSEGFTTYYSNAFIYRAGYSDETKVLDALKDNIQSLENNPGSQVQTLSEASFNAWIKYYRPDENSKNATVSYYTKGSVIAAMLNLDIMNSSKGEKSLDDVMKYLYDLYYKKLQRGFTEEELKNAFEKIAGKNYDDFFDKYINGLDRIPYEEYLLFAGLELHRKDGMKTPSGYLGATFNQTGNRIIVSYVERNSAAWNQGLSVNDEIINIDEKEPLQIKDYLASKQPGDTITIKFIRFGYPEIIKITLGEPTAVELEIQKVRKPTEMQEKIYRKMMIK